MVPSEGVAFCCHGYPMGHKAVSRADGTPRLLPWGKAWAGLNVSHTHQRLEPAPSWWGEGCVQILRASVGGLVCSKSQARRSHSLA